MASDKTYNRKIDLYFFRTKCGTFPQRDLVISRQEMRKRAQFIKTLVFLKEFISN